LSHFNRAGVVATTSASTEIPSISPGETDHAYAMKAQQASSTATVLVNDDQHLFGSNRKT
jgi:hypothetical protein